jgi:hypothetical protein
LKMADGSFEQNRVLPNHVHVPLQTTYPRIHDIFNGRCNLCAIGALRSLSRLWLILKRPVTLVTSVTAATGLLLQC